MTTALDTNILSGVWSSPPAALIALLAECRAAGRVVICGVVYAELSAHPNAGLHFVDDFLHDFEVEVDFAMTAAVWKLAGLAFAAYARRRRQSGGGIAKRILADFIVGAHAHVCADRLATLDRSRYAAVFPRPRLVAPA